MDVLFLLLDDIALFLLYEGEHTVVSIIDGSRNARGIYSMKF
jgi:hypothetical protein